MNLKLVANFELLANGYAFFVFGDIRNPTVLLVGACQESLRLLLDENEVFRLYSCIVFEEEITVMIVILKSQFTSSDDKMLFTLQITAFDIAGK